MDLKYQLVEYLNSKANAHLTVEETVWDEKSNESSQDEDA
jgi:hypothetical protein